MNTFCDWLSEAIMSSASDLFFTISGLKTKEYQAKVEDIIYTILFVLQCIFGTVEESPPLDHQTMWVEIFNLITSISSDIPHHSKCLNDVMIFIVLSVVYADENGFVALP